MKWISVKDRLPETKGWYLVSVCPEIVSMNRPIIEISDFYDGVDLNNGTRILRFQDYVTHWMPLPAPPTETPTNNIQLANNHAAEVVNQK